MAAGAFCSRGKSGLQRAGRRVTPGGGNPWKVPQKTYRLSHVAGVRVKRWGKSPPPPFARKEGTANPAWSKAV